MENIVLPFLLRAEPLKNKDRNIGFSVTWHSSLLKLAVPGFNDGQNYFFKFPCVGQIEILRKIRRRLPNETVSVRLKWSVDCQGNKSECRC